MGYRHILKSFMFVNEIKLTSFRIDNGGGEALYLDSNS